MHYDTGSHCVFYHRHHLVWSTKYRYKVLKGDIRLRVRDICRQVCRERGADVIRGVLSSDHVLLFVSVPPKLAISDLVRLMKGRSSHKVQREFPELKRRSWGKRFWGRGYFSTTNGAITEDIGLQSHEQHIADPTGNRMKRDLAIRALDMAVTFRQSPKGCIHHTDRGSQYCFGDYQKILRQHDFRVSMSERQRQLLRL